MVEEEKSKERQAYGQIAGTEFHLEKTDSIKEWETYTIRDSIEDIERNPIIKPMADYERHYLYLDKKAINELEILNRYLDEFFNLYDGLEDYRRMEIVRVILNILDTHRRLLFITKEAGDLGKNKILEIYRIAIKNYQLIPKKIPREKIETPKIENGEKRSETN